MTENPLTRDELDTLTGAAEPVQITRAQLRALPPDERLRAARTGQLRDVYAEIHAAEKARQNTILTEHYAKHPNSPRRTR